MKRRKIWSRKKKKRKERNQMKAGGRRGQGRGSDIKGRDSAR